MRADAAVDAAPLERYTGVLYRALAPDSWTGPQRRWAEEHLLVHSAELGPVPAGIAGACAVDLAQLAVRHGPLIDLRSKEYVKRAPLPPGQVTVRVVSEGSDGRRLAVSHWNKHHKGVFVGALVRSSPALDHVGALLAWSSDAGFRLEWSDEGVLDLVV